MNSDIRRKLDRITDILWAGGVTNPVTYIEQLSYLIFLKLLDEEESDRELRLFVFGLDATLVNHPDGKVLIWIVGAGAVSFGAGALAGRLAARGR